jgi:hypothetical protein
MMRTFVASALGIAAGIFGFAASVGLTKSWPAAAVIAAIAGVAVFLLARKPSVLPLDERPLPPGLALISAVATSGALLLLARITVFMVDSTAVAYSHLPMSDWEVRHSCLSAYFVAAEAISSTPDVYVDSLYTSPDDKPGAPRKPLRLGLFNIDVYEYPPPFLLLPRALRVAAPDFLPHRALWFALDGALVLAAVVVVARFIGGAAGTRALLFSPLIWFSLPMLSTLQKGNVQLVVIAGAMLAMVLFERRRWIAGGVLLGFMIVSKLYPGLLLVYLLMRRQWRAVAWTAASMIAFVGVSIADTGWTPYAAFLDHLPGLVGGEAFPAFRNPKAMAINQSVPGIVFKLGLFGVPGTSFASAKLVGWIYTLAALAATIALARRPFRESERPLAWMAVLLLATLRSPFLPQAYGAFPPLWLLTLLAAAHAPTTKTLALVLIAWLALNVYWPVDMATDPRALAISHTLPQATMVILALLVVRRKMQPEPVAV